MLVELAIRDLALIERAELSFEGGLNVITGETGAGKSLLIDALELLLGHRGRSSLIRRGASKARVEGRFLLASEGYGRLITAWMEEHLPETLEEWREEGEGPELELILTRTLSRDGRSRAHVNQRPVTQRILRDLAARLVEIHGQNDHQKLFESAEQRRLLDTFGELEDSLAGYRERRARWLQLAEKLQRFESGEAQRLQRLDLVRFQVGELTDVAATAGERDELTQEREVLRHAADLSSDLGELLEDLSSRDDAALDALRRCERRLDDWSAKIERLVQPSASLREASAHLEETVASLRSFLDEVEVDQARLELIEGRLGEFERLERKYQTDTDGLEELRSRLAAELVQLEAEGQGLEELEQALGTARRTVEESARRLSAARKSLGPTLVTAVEEGLSDLGLGDARFEVELAPRDAQEEGLEGDRRRLGPYGRERVEFLLAANPGESRAPLRTVASGGEAARVMLALRGALAVQQSTPTLVFDEVDAGVGGRLGPRVASHLQRLAGHHQVLCVTHLPSIAAGAERHLRVVKEIRAGRTRTHVAELEGEPRVAEVADMIAGGSAHETALAEARRLLGRS